MSTTTKRKKKTFTMFDTEAIKIKIRKQCRNLHCKQTISYLAQKATTGKKKKIQTIAKQLAYSFEDIYLSPLEPKQRTPRTN